MSNVNSQGCLNTAQKGMNEPEDGWPRWVVSRRRDKPIWGKIQIRELQWLIRGEERCFGFITSLRSRPNTQFIEGDHEYAEFERISARGDGRMSHRSNYRGAH
jgi:hypothetical protein